MSFTFLDPMRRDYRGKEDDSVAEIIEGDLLDISHSDIILVNATRPSWGTAMEVRHSFAEKGKVVVTWCPGSVSPWLRGHSTVILPTLPEAVDYIKAHYYGETVYLCGGINGLSDSDATDWREYAKGELANEPHSLY